MTDGSALKGLAIADPKGKLIFKSGLDEDKRLALLLGDPDWLTEAAQARLKPILFTDARYTALVTRIEAGTLVLLFKGVSDTVLTFFTNVDFAFDIIEHILTDPFDAMAVVDARDRLVYISPVHEKFFGLRPGEGTGRPVKQVIENTRLPHVIRSGVAEIGQIQRMGERERVVSRHPIRHDGKVVGAIGRVMFKGPQQVEALSKRINVLEKQIASYKSESDEQRKGETFLSAIIGKSAAIERVRDLIRKVAPLDVPVLVQGESGTGKELVAQALHMLSPRHKSRLVTVNAAALPLTLVEAELFGYAAGSFTGADRNGRAGKFEQADKGTIFLDEIGDMPLEVQSKLLRVLQDRVVERVGGDKPSQVDFRLVSATNRDLEDFVERDRFRLDLYYRISPICIPMPSLSERLEDIPLLVEHFLTDLSARYQRPKPEADEVLFDFLMDRPWPGNIRELRHMIERAFVFCEGDRLRPDDFRGLPVQQSPASPVSSPEPGAQRGMGTLRDTLEQVERNLIAETLNLFGGNKKRAAEHLGISRSYLYKKIEA
ncbi:sigma-54-dependent Fis family transcriptional regulator [Paracoccus sp. J39]|uniref:sigma-54 interaction domain-containing protein n=1 Tax=Paracoccus sp. J39 TaxID=935848 RepID=UPI0004AD2AC7|nr:sigma-54-dependent Fis family transcriptional regulator [Paracoccus sp. J39]